MSLLAQVNNAISTGRLSAPLARALRRVARGPQVLLQRDILIPVGTLVAQDVQFVNPFALPGKTPGETIVIIEEVLLTVSHPSTGTAAAYDITVGTTLGGAELLLAQSFANPQTFGDTRGVVVAQLGAGFTAANRYRVVFGGAIDVFVRIDVTGAIVASNGKVRLTITGHPLLP